MSNANFYSNVRNELEFLGAIVFGSYLLTDRLCEYIASYLTKYKILFNVFVKENIHFSLCKHL